MIKQNWQFSQIGTWLCTESKRLDVVIVDNNVQITSVFGGSNVGDLDRSVSTILIPLEVMKQIISTAEQKEDQIAVDKEIEKMFYDDQEDDFYSNEDEDCDDV